MNAAGPSGARRGVYPGSFNPPTIGHLTIVEAAITQHRLDELVVTVSRRALAKETVERPLLDHRIDVMRSSFGHLAGVTVAVTGHQLIADIAEGYDVVVMGADKWTQVNDLSFYDDEAHRQLCLERLPTLAVAARGDDPVPDECRLVVPDHLGTISSSSARSGAIAQMTDAARTFDEQTGAWTDPQRYERWIRAADA